MGRRRYVWVTLLPMAWLVTVTLTASYQKIWHPDPRVGFLAQASALQGQLDAGTVAPERVVATQRIIFNNNLDAGVTALFAVLLFLLLAEAAYGWAQLLLGRQEARLHEAPHVPTAWAEVA
jgi:carbon starvation protein